MLEIVVIAVITLCCLSILWFTLKTGISPMPSSGKVCRCILKASEQASEGTIIDLGCGWGGMAFALARKYPDRQVIGYEVSWLPWAWSKLCKSILQLQNLKLCRLNFLTTELPEASLLVCYLHPKGMIDLQKKLSSNRQGVNSLLISSTFALPESSPVETIRLKDLYNTPIYIYRLTNR
ncbi:Methyltransferase small domain-containing protein [Mariprofundus aestuarium]|uniref:Methyltransferase small domain-containing protein n=1 Tax=Mariprofundus aestuarium TaxID=1921086 RepID=A0A2K8KYW3_MARES|nr:methyltransferase [Mariprofundus aestuarium]ATX79089.1 Methyltransferase small domain-containing protein [Mariprofundus aestuarium]